MDSNDTAAIPRRMSSFRTLVKRRERFVTDLRDANTGLVLCLLASSHDAALSAAEVCALLEDEKSTLTTAEIIGILTKKAAGRRIKVSGGKYRSIAPDALEKQLFGSASSKGAKER